MALGVQSNLKIYQDQFYGGFNEVLAQNSDAFNERSANAIRLFTSVARGYYSEEAFFETISGLVSRRDITSTSDVDNVNLAADSMIAPKLFSGTPKVWNTLSSLQTAGIINVPDEDVRLGAWFFRVGEQVAKAMLDDMLNRSLTCAVATTGKSANTYVDITGASTKTLNYQTGLIATLAKFGDRGQDIVAWVMHSKPFYDLMGSNIGVAADRVAGATIYEGTAGTMGRPVIVTDSASLVVADGGGTGINSYYTFGLREGALDVRLSELPVFATGLDPDYKAGIAQYYRSDWAYNVRVLGYSMTANNTNPTDAQLANGGNWTQAFTSPKWTAGIRLETL